MTQKWQSPNALYEKEDLPNFRKYHKITKNGRKRNTPTKTEVPHVEKIGLKLRD